MTAALIAPTASVPRRRSSPELVALLGLVAVATLALAPLILRPNAFAHSAIYNYAWQGLFSDEVARGRLYPRWLPGASHGFGGPGFYFYPPLAFHVGALFDLLTGRRLPPPQVVDGAAWLLLCASGAAMYAWLRDQARDRRTAWIGAAAYLLAPYHLFDIYIRGALAEFAAFAFVPLVALGVRKLARGERFGGPLLALSYAGLLLSHLPVALLATLTLLPLQVAYEATTSAAERRTRFLAGGAVFGGLGLLLAAPFLLPAMTLQGAVRSSVLWSPYYQAERWLMADPRHWASPSVMSTVGAFALAAGLLAVGLILAMRRSRSEAGGDRAGSQGAIFWCGAALLTVVMLSGLVPGLWRLPSLAKVQFPWRMLALTEFALVTGAALTPPAVWRAFSLPIKGAAALFALIGAALVGLNAIEMDRLEQSSGAELRAHIAADRREPIEYLPADFADFQGDDAALPSPRLINLREYPTAETADHRHLAATDLDGGGLSVTAPGGGARVLLHRFVFPAWRVTGPDGREIATAPFGPAQRLSFVADRPGIYTARIVPLPVERVGWSLAALAAAGLLAAAALEFRRKR